MNALPEREPAPAADPQAALEDVQLLLGGVMALAMLLNLVVSALAGIFIPLVMERFGRDPAVGSSVFLTFITDSMGFFIFLGLATLFLL